MRTRLLATDLDGTLLTAKRIPHPASAHALKRAVQAGITVVLASGRIYPGVRKIAAEAGLPTHPAICSNGSHVAGDAGDILALTLSSEAFEAVARYALDNDIHLNAYTREHVLFIHETHWADEYLRRTRLEPPLRATVAEAAELGLMKAMLIDHPSRIAHHRRKLQADLASAGARPTESEPEYLEFMDQFANKGNALRTLAESLGFRREETAAIGDYLNDIEMIEWAGISGAVANAAPELIARARHVVGSNEDGGVAEFVDSVILNGRE